MDESKRVPFGRNIPHFPSEDLSPGMPTTPEESVFLSSPELAHTANVVVDYALANSKTRKHIEDRTVEEILANPRRLADIFDALELLKETGGYTKINEFEQTLTHNLEKVRLKELQQNTEVFRQFLSLISHSAVYGPLAEKILGTMIAECKDTRSVITELYALATAGLMSGDSSVMKKTLEILGLQTNVLSVNSHAAIMFHLSVMDNDDTVLRMALDIQSIFQLFSALQHPEVYEAYIQKKRILTDLPEYRRGLVQVAVECDPVRFAALEKLYSHDVDELGSVEIETGENVNLEEFPYNLIMAGGGPLRELHNQVLSEELARRTGKRVITIHLPFTHSVYKENVGASLAEMIRDALNAKAKNHPALEAHEYWETLSYLVPESLQSENQLRTVGDVNESFKQEMLYDSKYLLSPRGDYVEIIDPSLKELGFRSITYHMDQRNKRDTIVTLMVGNFSYKVLLDEFFVLRSVDTRNPMNLPLEGNVLQHIVLGHLHEIRCSSRAFQLGDDDTSSRPGKRSAPGVHSRRAFRRELPEGENPTIDQIRRALAEYHIDINRMNREAAARGQIRRYTWVCEVENVVPGQGPVRSQRPHATRQLQKILADSTSTQADTSS